MTGQHDALLAAIVRTSLDCIIVINHEGLVVEFNPAAETTFGYRRDDAIGRPIGDLIVPPHLRAAHHSGLARYLREGDARVLNRRVEIEAQRANGERFPVELAITEVAAGDGRYFAASLRDLSASRRMEAERDDLDARLNAFMQHAPIGMYLKDGQGRYIMANPEFTKVFGEPLEAILGKGADDFLPPEEAEVVKAFDAEVLATGQPRSVEEFLQGKRDYAWTLVMRFPLWSEAAQEWRVGGFDIDITPLKQAAEEVRLSQAALHQSEKLNALGNLLAGVSHELNNPLAVVIAQAGMLEMQTEGTPLAERATRIKRAAERCARIVGTFLAMARQKPPQQLPLSLNTLADSVLDLVAYTLRTSRVAVEKAYDPAVPLTSGDPDQLHQVVLNLVMNAIQAMDGQDAERHLRIRTGCDAGSVWIEVHDSGPGISGEIESRIFDPFFTTKEHGKGTGLGLSFSRAIVEGHGGTLKLLGNGQGACLRVTLPVAAAGEVGPDTRPPVMGTRTRRALIIDDEPEVAHSLAEMLTLLGVHTDVAGSGAAALAKIETQAYDLILCDLRMPDLDGETLFGRLADRGGEVVSRLAFVTGDTLNQKAETFLARAARPVLHKPFDFDAVRRLLREFDL
jgi:PAS domain S-box-containing protein